MELEGNYKTDNGKFWKKLKKLRGKEKKKEY